MAKKLLSKCPTDAKPNAGSVNEHSARIMNLVERVTELEGDLVRIAEVLGQKFGKADPVSLVLMDIAKSKQGK